MKIVVVGSLNMDFVVHVEHLPTVGETVLSDSFNLVPGGKGANQAFALGRMGADVIMLGAVGNDVYGDIEIENLQNAGVETCHIQRVNEQTGSAFISVDTNGNNNIIVVQGANRLVSVKYIESKLEVLKQADIVLMQLEIPLDTVIYTASIANDMGKTVILDPAPALGELPDTLLQNVDIIKPNEVELETLTGFNSGEDQLNKACRKLIDHGVDTVLASLGEKGAYVSTKGGISQLFPCESIKVVDSTAAGDSFTAAIAYCLSRGHNILQAVPFANRIAGLVVAQQGAQSSIPSSNEINKIWESLNL